DEPRPGERLAHEDGRDPVPAPDIRRLRAIGQARVRPVESRDPGLDEVATVAGREEPLGPAEQARVVVAPRDAAAALERGLDLRLIAVRGLDQIEGAADVARAALVGQAERLLLGEGVLAVLRVVLDVAARGLVQEPFLQVPLAAAGFSGKIRR